MNMPSIGQRGVLAFSGIPMLGRRADQRQNAFICNGLATSISSISMSVTDTLKAWARRVKRDGVTLWFAGRHPLTPWYAKALAMFVVAYALSPIDLIPDFIPVLGFVDDALLLPGLIWLVIRLLPPEVLTECRLQADAWMQAQGTRPRSWVGAALIVGLWLALGILIWLWTAPH